MIPKSFDEIGWADLERMVAGGASEGRQLEFKLALPGGRDADVKEFLADLTSFANSDGGDLIFGVRDRYGVAAAVEGVATESVDAAILRLDNIARDGVDPRISGLRIGALTGEGGRAALLVRVPASFAGPHRVSYKGSSRFFARNSRGKYEMDTHDLGQAFAASEALPRRLHGLHQRTLAAGRGENMPMPLVDGPTALVTVAPVSILRDRIDLAMRRENALLPPQSVGGLDLLVGFEGVVVLASVDQARRAAGAFAINHRSGYMSAGWFIGRVREDERIVWPKYVVEMLPGFVASAIARLREHGLAGPWVVMATVRGVKDFRLILPDHHWSDPAWQDDAYLGDLMIEDLGPKSMQPLIDGFGRLFGIDPATGHLPW